MAKKPAARPSVPAAQEPKRHHVLVVDDDQDLSEFLRTVLHALGYAPVVAHSLEQGRHALVSLEPPVVIVDVMMPDGGVDAVLGFIRKYRDYTRFVAISGYFNDPLMDRFLAEGVRACLHKPLELDVFKEHLRSLIELYEKSPRPGGQIPPS